MAVSRLGMFFALALPTMACHGGGKHAGRDAGLDAAVAHVSTDAAPAPATVVMEDLAAPVPHAALVTDLPGGRLLASGRRGVAHAIVVGAHVYFASESEGTIQRVPLAGGRFETVARGQAHPYRLAARAGMLYWIDRGVESGGAYAGGTLMRAPLAGGEASVLMAGLVDPVALVFDGPDVLVATRRQVWRVPAAGGRARLLHGELADVAAIAVAGTSLFVATQGDATIWRVPLQGGDAGKPEAFAEDVDHVVALLVDGARLYWVAQGSGGGEGEIASRPLAGGAVEVIADALEHPRAAVIARGGQLAWLAEGPDGHEPSRWASLFVRGKDGKSHARLSTPHGARALAVSDSGWVMAGPSEILYVPFAPAPRQRAYVPVAAAPGQPRALAADRDAIYWVTYQGAVMRAPRAGGAPQLLAHAPRGLSAMALEGGAVAWTCYDCGGIGRVGAAGGPAVDVASDRHHPIAIAARAGELYFADDDGVHVVAAGGGPVRRLASLGGAPHALAVDDEAVYALAAAPGGDRLVRVPLAGGAVELLVDGLDAADQLAVDGEWVYVLDEEPDADFPNARGEVWRTPRRAGRGGRERLAAGLMSPNGLAVGAGFAWFAYADGRVARVPVDGGSVEIVAGPGRNVGALCPDGADLLVASGGTLQGDWKDGAILRLELRK